VKGIRYITEGAALLALFVALLLFLLYIPVIGGFLTLALAVPFIVYTVRHGVKRSILFFIVSLLLTLLFGTVVTLPATMVFGISGIVIGYLYQQKKARYSVLLGGTIAFSLAFLLMFVLSSLLMNVNLISEMNNALNQSIDQSVDMMKSLGQTVTDEQIQQLEQTITTFKYLLPLFIAMLGVVCAFFSQLIAASVLKRLKHDIESFPPFRELQLPKSVIWYYLIVLILSFPSFNFEEGSFMFIAILNLAMALQMLVMLQGFSFIFYFSYQKGYSKAIPVIVTILAFILPILLQFVRILGIIDLGFNLRKRIGNVDK